MPRLPAAPSLRTSERRSVSDIFRPMLATDADLSKLRFPLLASAKLDGVRAVVRDGVVYSRSNKPIPNAGVQTALKSFESLDGELICGDPTSKSCYRDTVSVVMSHDKPAADVRFFVFDHVSRQNTPYAERCKSFADLRQFPRLVRHQQVLCASLEDVLDYETECLEAGYEGLILRDPNAPYKNGRSTVNEGFLLKLKRFVDSEAEIVGFEERMHNGNEATTNELGRTKRSSHKDGKTGRGDLGALILKRPDGVTFNCGTGFDDGLRQDIWDNQRKYLGKIAKYKHFEIGAKDLPRHPVFLGLRDRRDL